MNSFLDTYPFLTIIASLLIELMILPGIIKIARKQHFVVKPNKRTSHDGEVPNVGGIGICAACLLSFVCFEYSSLDYSQFILIGILVIVMIGFADDILDITPCTKLLGEALAGIALIGFADVRLTHLHGFLGIHELGLIPSYLLSFFVLIAVINAVNLIDGVDGLASGLGIVYCAFFAIYFNLCGELSWASLGYSMIGALVIFFCYNVFGKSKRKIFMGDSGSLLLGYLITAFVFKFCELNAYHKVPASLHCSGAPAVAIGVLSIPLFDTIRVMVIRIKHKKSPFYPDKNHLHHLLLRAGLNHIQTTLVIIGISLLNIGLAYWTRNWNMWLSVGLICLSCGIATIAIWYVANHKPSKTKQ